MFYKLLNAYTRQFPFPHRGLKYFLKATDRLGITDKIYTKKLAGKFYMQLNPTEHIQQQLLWYGYYEKSLGDVLRKIVKPGDVFVDIGANIGYFSLLIATDVPTAKVISFEPVRDIFQQLKGNTLLNNVKNIIAFNAAVGEVKEEKDIFVSDTDNLGMSSFKQPENFSGKTERVQVLTLDDWFSRAGLAKIDVIKIDVEGSELNALKGMKQVLQSFKPVVIVEINPGTLSMFGLNSSDIFDYLAGFNFDAFLILESGGIIEWKKKELNETANVLFVHHQKKELLSSLMHG